MSADRRAALDDPRRVAALERSGMLDSPSEDSFDRLTRLAGRILGVPVSLVSLVDDRRQFFKSQVGLPEPWASARETPLSHSFCQHVVSTQKPLVVADARTHPMLSTSPAISELGVVAYASVPLTTADGQTLGSFCAIDTKPRPWTEAEVEILTELAASVMTEIELKVALREARHRADGAERERNARLALLDSTTDGVVGIDPDGRCTFVNRAASRMLGWSADELLGLPMHATIHHSHPDGSPYPVEECPIMQASRSGRESRNVADVYWRKDGSSVAVEYSSSPVRVHGANAGAVVTFIDITGRRRAERRSQIQHAVSVVLADAATEEEAGTRILEAVGQALGWNLGTLWLVDAEASVLRSRATWRSSDAYERFEWLTSQLSFAPGAGLPGTVWVSQQPLWDMDISQRPELPRAAVAGEVGLHGAVLFPIRGGRQVLGVAEFVSDSLEEPDTELLRALATIGNQIGQYIERRRAEQDVRRSNALNSSILAAAIDCVITIDHDGRVKEWNPAAQRTFGYTRQEALGRDMAELIIPPALREAHRAGMTGYFRTGEGPVIDRRIETTGLRRNGSEFPLELAVTRIPFEDPPMFTGYLRDITERTLNARATEEQVRLASLTAAVAMAISRTTTLDDMLRLCTGALVQWLDAALARIWMLDEAGDVLELKASSGLDTRLDGLHARISVGQHKIGSIAATRQPLLTNELLLGVPGIDAEWAAREGLVAFAGLPLVVENHLVGVVALFARRPLPDATLNAMAAVANGIAVGVERKGALDALSVAKEAAEAASIAKSRFLANMSHELRTPLNAVILYSELLQEEAEDRGVVEFIPDLEKIRRAGRHLLSLINGVLDLAKVEAGRMELHLETVDVRQELSDVVATLQPLLDQNHNALDLQVADDVGPMFADVTKVRQLLINLISNAAKFTDHGTVTVRVSLERDDSLAELFVLRVRDTGIGMSPEQITRVFEPFRQADDSVTRRYGGTGLGMAICSEFAALMGGTIGVESELGQGTEFTLRLPMTGRPAAQETGGAEHGTAEADALVIDDDAATRDTVMAALTEQGLTSVAAADGEEGLRLAKRFRPRIIFLDVLMPKMDGWAVLAELKADPALHDVAVVLLTISSNQELGYLLGADDYLVKPLDPERVTAILVKYQLLRETGAALVIDDHEATRAVVRKLLERDGWAVEEAEHGRAALERLAERNIALIVLDLIMPEMDGFEFLNALREQPAWRSIPVMVMTSKDLSRRDRARLAGRVETIVRKGVHSHGQVIEQIRDIVRRHRIVPGAAAMTSTPHTTKD